MEEQHIRRVSRATAGNTKRAAELLGISRTSLEKPYPPDYREHLKKNLQLKNPVELRPTAVAVGVFPISASVWP